MTSNRTLASGQELLQAGRWDDARTAFEAVLSDDPGSPDAHAGLRDVYLWTGQVRRSVEHGERAYLTYRRRGDTVEAALSAFWLCLIYQSCLGNRPAGRGWLARAESLSAKADLAPIEGWLNLGRALFSTDNERSRELLDLAVATAQEYADPDLELCSMAELGVALVKMGEVDDGLRHADEAMAGALAGEGSLLDTVVMTGCSVLAACDLVGDVDRVAKWSKAADEFTRTYGAPYLYGNCRMVYARVLVLTGRWNEAEAELTTGLERTRETFPGLHARMLATLVDLRLRQGRFEEAEALIDSAGGAETALPAAALALRRGEPSTAVRLVERWLAGEEDDVSSPVHAGGVGTSIEVASALCLLVEAQLAAGNAAGAASAADQLTKLAETGATGVAAAHAALVRGRLAAHSGDENTAVRCFEEAMRRFGHLDLPMEGAQARVALARCLAPTQPTMAISEGRAALAALEQLGAASEADAVAALLRTWGAAGRTGPRDVGILTRREQEVLGLLAAGMSNQEIADRLYISRKTAAHHVSNLLAKLGVRNRSEAAAYAVSTGVAPQRGPT